MEDLCMEHLTLQYNGPKKLDSEML
jgi:hypothetical protein